MEKPAHTKYPIHHLIKNRWSPVCFDASKNVEPEQIGSLFEAIRWAASSFNEQPWVFLLGTKDNKEAYDKLFSCIMGFNQEWVQNAPVIAIAVTKMKFDHNQTPNRHAFHDIGLALGNLCLQAEAMSLRVHFMGGFDVEKTRKIYNIPEDYEPVTAIAIGYEGNVNNFPAQLQERDKKPRTRKPLQEFVFTDDWDSRYFVDL